MRTTVKATNIEHTNAIDAYLAKRLSELERILEPKEKSELARIELGKLTKHHRTGEVFFAEITFHVKKKDFRATAEGVVEQCCGMDTSIDDIGFISKVIDQTKKDFNVDAKRVYSTGLSNGGLMSYTLACNLADKITAIAPVAPSGTPDACNPSRPVPVMHIHGTADPIAPYNGGLSGEIFGNEGHQVLPAKDVVSKWRRIDGCTSATQNTYQKGTASCVTNNQCNGGTEVTLCTVTGMGHTYPSGKQYMSVAKIGPVSSDISFDQIWEFFKKYSL